MKTVFYTLGSLVLLPYALPIIAGILIFAYIYFNTVLYFAATVAIIPVVVHIVRRELRKSRT